MQTELDLIVEGVINEQRKAENAFYPFVEKICSRMIWKGDFQIASDVLDDVKARTVNQIFDLVKKGGYQGEAALRKLTERVFVRTFLNTLQHEQSLRRRAEKSNATSIQTEDALANVDLYEVLAALIQSLSREERLLIHLRVENLLKHKEIAERLDITEESARQKWIRLLRRVARIAGSIAVLRRFLDN